MARLGHVDVEDGLAIDLLQIRPRSQGGDQPWTLVLEKRGLPGPEHLPNSSHTILAGSED